MELATLGGGCFWCVEAVFQRLEGVEKVVSGYAGGTIPNPTYRDICTGLTGHAEVIQITFDNSKISFEELLEVFWMSHDPTTLNRQGADRGTQYRSVIFYHTLEQKSIAEKSMAEVAPAIWENPIVTEIAPISTFYPGEVYHQNYYNNHKFAPYCMAVIHPKLAKLEANFIEKMKTI